MKVALISTVKNEETSIANFLGSIDEQTRPPDEVILVDGGSSDSTWQQLQGWAEGHPHRVVRQEIGANISRGRNLAIAMTQADAIAVTDGGCILDRRWLEHLASGLESGADVSMGFTVTRPRNFFERVSDVLNNPSADEIDPVRFMPSSRSIAFRRAVWERVGGYPEWLPIGEDMLFNHLVMEAGHDRTFVADALVLWEMQPTLGRFLRQYYRYSRGDGQANIHARRHALRYAAYLGVVVIATSGHPLMWVVPAAGASWWLRAPIKRAQQRLNGRERFTGVLLLPILNALMDVAKMAGHIAGTIRRFTGQGSNGVRVSR